MSDPTASRVMERLREAELQEPDIWFRQDYRQAFMCVSLADRDEPAPFVTSSYQVYGTHPDRVWPKIMLDRRLRLGREFSDWYDEDGNWKPDIPKKNPTIYIDDQAERALAGKPGKILVFPKREAQRANVEQTGSVRESEKRKGNLYEMPAPPRPEERQPLRILPA